MNRFLWQIFLLLCCGITLLGCDSTPRQSNATDGEFVRITNKPSSTTINDIVEDKMGYIWIATDRGLNKYNGYDYHQYYRSTNPNSLSDNQVKVLHCDSRGILWVGTVLGLCHYTKEDDFAHIEFANNSANYINAIHETAQGRIVVRTMSSFEVVEWRDGVAYPTLSQPLNTPWCTTFSDPEQRVWIVGANSIQWWDFDNGTCSEQIAVDATIYHAYMSPNGVLWLLSFDGKHRLYDTLSGEFIPAPKSLDGIRSGIKSIMDYSGGCMLFYTEDLESWIYNPRTQQFTLLDEENPSTPKPNGVLSTTAVDSSGNVWYGSLEAGLSVQYAHAKQFDSNPKLTQRLAHKSVMGIAEDSKGNLFFSTFKDGIWRWNVTTNEIVRLTVEGEQKSMRAERIFIDSEDNLYANYPFMTIKYNIGGGNTLFVKNLYFTGGGKIYDLMRDSRGRVWGGTNLSSLVMLGEEPNQITAIPLESAEGDSQGVTPEVVELADGRIMTISLIAGITLFDAESLEQSHISTREVLDDLFIPTALRQTTSGEVWIGTRGQGLLVFNPADNSLRVENRILCKEIMEIVEGEEGELWISTMEGLTHYDRKQDKFLNFYASDGTGGDQYNESVGLRTSNGNIIFGGTHGVTYFNPRSVNNHREANLYIEALYINNKLQHPYNSRALEEHIAEAKRVDLWQREDVSIGFSFVALNYSEYPMLYYTYRMEGYEEEWVDVRSGRRAFYSNLPAGKYNFQVRVWNNDYSQMVAERSVEVVVHPPLLLLPVMKWGVYPLMGLALLLGAFLLLKRHRRNQVAMAQAILEKEQERRNNQMNMSFFVNISHEMRTPLTMIKGPLELLSADSSMSDENRNLLGLMSRNVNRLLRFLGQLMDISKLDNKQMRLEVGYSDVVNVINQMVDVFAINAEEKGILITRTGLNDKFISLINEDKLEKIVSNLVTNALKFTPSGGRIDIAFDVISREAAGEEFALTAKDNSASWIKLSVTDTGCGIPEENLEQIFERYYQVEYKGKAKKNYGTGIGLYYSRCLAELHHGYIKAENRHDSSGARFTLILPTSEMTYENDEHRYGKESKCADVVSSIVEPSPLQMTIESDHRQRLLIVEDETEMARFVKTVFAKEYHVTSAYNAESAIEQMEQELPDLVISDVVMPGAMDGYGLCRRIKEDPHTCHIPVILLTAKTDVEAQVEGLDAGADAYVMKPFEPSYMMALVGSLFSNRDKIRGLMGKATHTSTISDEQLSPFDKEFLDSLYELMENELSNTELNITRMTEVLKIGRTRFYYKVKGLTGENPNVFFKTYKLNRASELLLEEKYNISEVADMTGFSTLSHFSTSFKKQFGCSPSEWVAERRKTE